MLSGALRSRNFRLLLACDVVSLTGNAVALVALPFAVLAVGGSAADVGYVSTAMLVPVVVFLLLGGVVADRLPRHLVMVAGDIVQAAAQAISAAVVLSGHGAVWPLLVLAALRGTGFGFYFPAEAGLLPQTVAPDDRAQANAIDRVARNGAQIAGAALGGVAVATLGPGWGLALNAVSFAGAALLRVGMRFGALPPAESSGMVRELREGWREFVSRRWLWTIVVQFACVNAVVLAAINVLGPLVAMAHYGGARSWGLVLAAYSVGSMIGGIAMIRLRPARMLLVATIAVLGSPLVLFALVPPLMVPLVAAAALLTGACFQVFGVNWATTMQQEIPLSALSRVSAYDALGSFALAPAGTAVAGPLAGAFGPSPVLLAGGALIMVLTAAVLLVPEVRSLRRTSVAALGGAVQLLELAGDEGRMAPPGLGGAGGQGAGDVHPVRGFQEDDLGSQGPVVEPAAGGGHRDGVAVAVGVVRHGPAAGADGDGQRVGLLDEADLPAIGPRRHLD